jgi:light-independent protochlorophyllide reductase subunit B
MGFEGANVIFDTWVHPLVMGLEEHLLTMFRDDFEFSDAAGPSHLGHGAAPAVVADDAAEAEPVLEPASADIGGWTADAQRELMKIPFFVRGKARRNTERYASEKGVAAISVETLYEAKAHYAR